MKILTPEILRQARIVTTGNVGEAGRFAAGELQKYIQEIIKVSLPVIPAAGTSEFDFILEVLHDEKICHDGFRFEATRSGLRITANLPRGILNGVYTLLAEWGCRWFFQFDRPIIPSLNELPLPESKVVNPDLELRGVCVFSLCPENQEDIRQIIDWMGKNRFNMLMTAVNRTKKRKNGWIVEWEKVEHELLPELRKRGIILNISEHSGRYFFPISQFDEHPEWFAMNKEGQRHCKGQICYSNHEAIKVLTANMVKYAAEHPEMEIFGTWPEDGYGFCQCENCVKPGTVLKAVNHIADALKEIRPELTVEYLSYTAETSEVPPGILPRDNISILVANTRVAREWKDKTDAVDGRGVYRLHYHISDNTAERANLPLTFGQTLHDCSECHREGIRGIIPFFIGTDTWWRSSINLYFLTRFSWDTSLKVSDVLNDFCVKWFGAAAKPMEEIFLRLEKIPRVDQSHPPRWPLWQEWESMKTDYNGPKWSETMEYFKKMREDIAKAEVLAPELAVRFRPVYAFIDFQETMFLSWHHRALAVEAFEKNDALTVRKQLKQTAHYEQILAEQVQYPDKTIGVAGAWIDYSFFLNWRLQLDKQLLEMKTVEQMIPISDENPEMELFLPGLLNS